MDKTLNEIILEWIGEDIKTSRDDYESTATNIQSNQHNKTLADLRERIPELVDKIDKKNAVKCENCGSTGPDVSYRQNSYAQEIGGISDAMHTVCDECDYQNLMAI